MTTEMTHEAQEEVNGGAPEAEVVVQNSESSPETHVENKQQVSDNTQDRFNQLTAEKYALKKRIAELESGQGKKEEEKPAQVTQAPQLPDDLYDDEAMRKYHADMIKYSADAARQAAASTYQEQQLTNQQQAQQAEMQKTIQAYAQQGMKDGLTVDKMHVNEQILVGSGLDPNVGMYIMNDSNGAKIADYLASHQDQLNKINGMNQMQAAVYIANEIKLKALAPSNVSKAPEPTDTPVNGSGVTGKDDFDSRCPGATFD